MTPSVSSASTTPTASPAMSRRARAVARELAAYSLSPPHASASGGYPPGAAAAAAAARADDAGGGGGADGSAHLVDSPYWLRAAAPRRSLTAGAWPVAEALEPVPVFSARRVLDADLSLLMTSASPETPVWRRRPSHMSGASDGCGAAEAGLDAPDERAAGAGHGATDRATDDKSQAAAVVVERDPGGGGAMEADVSDQVVRTPGAAVIGPGPRAGAGGGAPVAAPRGCGCVIA